jgi:hypothetical protein
MADEKATKLAEQWSRVKAANQALNQSRATYRGRLVVAEEAMKSAARAYADVANALAVLGHEGVEIEKLLDAEAQP